VDVIKTALHSMVVFGSRLNAQRVVWSGQQAPRVEGPWMDIRITSIRPIGKDFRSIEDASLPVVPGQEIVVKTRGAREMRVGLRCFASPTGVDPQFILNDVVARSQQTSQVLALNAAGIGLAAWGPIQDIDGVVGGTLFEPRSIVEMRSFLASEVEEYSTYIERVELTVNLDAFTETVIVEES